MSRQPLCSTKIGMRLQRRLEHLAGDFCCYHPTYMEAHGVRKEQPYHITPRNESTLAILQVGSRLSWGKTIRDHQVAT